jgi:gluconokinase
VAGFEDEARMFCLSLMSSVPRSATDPVDDLLYFARMLDKIRLHARGALREDFHANLGKGADHWCTAFLHVEYDALKQRVLEGGSDEEILAWCRAHGRELNDVDRMVWNQFVTKLGWNDFASQRLQQVKIQSGLAGRDDIQTMAHYFDVDEDRKP